MFVPWLEPSSFCRSALELFDSGCQPEQLISHDTNMSPTYSVRVRMKVEIMGMIWLPQQ